MRFFKRVHCVVQGRVGVNSANTLFTIPGQQTVWTRTWTKPSFFSFLSPKNLLTQSFDRSFSHQNGKCEDPAGASARDPVEAIADRTAGALLSMNNRNWLNFCFKMSKKILDFRHIFRQAFSWHHQWRNERTKKNGRKKRSLRWR